MLIHRVQKRTVAPLATLALFLAMTLPSLAAIRAGDTLFVKVWNHPELSKQVTVDATGGVRVPLSGTVAVSGLDEAAAGKKLAAALARYIVYPAVSVETVDQGKSIFISGGPGGVIKYQPGETLAAAIADVMLTVPANTQQINASGQSTTKVDGANAAVRARIDLRNVRLQRDGAMLGQYDTIAFAAKGEPGPVLQPGDTIVFAYKPIEVRVVGDVVSPGATYLSSDQSISEAITQAGGLLPTSVSNHVLLQRGGQTQSLALGDPTFNQPAQSGDVLIVPQAPRVNVAGMVTTPGVVALKTDPSLLSALYTAGGPTKWADLRNVQIVHGATHTSYDVTRLTHGDISQNPILQDGDTVVVPEGHKVDFSGFFGILGALASRVTL